MLSWLLISNVIMVLNSLIIHLLFNRKLSFYVTLFEWCRSESSKLLIFFWQRQKKCFLYTKTPRKRSNQNKAIFIHYKIVILFPIKTLDSTIFVSTVLIQIALKFRTKMFVNNFFGLSFFCSMHIIVTPWYTQHNVDRHKKQPT